MKLIDRYILRQLAVPLGYCLLTFCMLFVVFDLFDHLSDFLDARTPPLHIARYYVYLLPGFLVYVVPLSLLLGLLYSLWQLTKHNELTALRASGVSLIRMTFPIVLVGMAFSVMVTTLQETVAPRSTYWARQFMEQQRVDDDKRSPHFALNLTMKNEKDHRIWFVRSFDLNTYDMQGVKVESDRETLYAEEAKFYDGRWWLFKVTVKKHDRYKNEPIGAVTTEPQRQMVDWAETPQDFLQEVKEPTDLSSRELHQFICAHENLSGKTKARVLVDLYTRLAMPWTCLVVTFFGIPCGVRTARKGAFVGVITALLTFFAFYLLMTVGQWLGKEQYLTPLVSAWLPNVAFTLTGLSMLARLR